MEFQKEKKIEKEKTEKDFTNKLEDNIIIYFQKIKDIINKLFIEKRNYNEIKNFHSFMSKIANKINSFYNKFNNKYALYNNENKIMKYAIKLERNINFYFKIFCYSKHRNNFDKNIKINKLCNKKEYAILINSFFMLKKYINETNHLGLQKYLKLLFYFHHLGVISLIALKLIIEFYISIFSEIIIIKSHYLSYIDDLIESIITYPYQNEIDKANNLYNSIIVLFKEYFLGNVYIQLQLSKSPIWLKLLNIKIINNIDRDKLSNFLVKIYKYNLTINFLFDNIYKQSVIDLNYYSNALNFLSALFKQEEITKKDYCNFYIKNGFYIPKNNPLILEKIKFKENEFSLIFSFKIINDSLEKEKNDEEIIIFNLSNNANGNIILKFIINKDKTVNIIHANKEWKIDKLKIIENKDYLVCLTQSYPSFKSTKFFFYINSINNNTKEKNNLANKNVIINNNNIKTKKEFIKYNTFNIQSSYPYFDNEMILELGKSNFNGIIGDFIIINRKINENDICNLFNLNGYYSYFVENTNDRYDLISKFDTFYIYNKENLNFFRKLNFNCILKILSYKLNNKFIKDQRGLKIENNGTLKHKNNNIEINIIDIKYSIDVFYNKYGIEFLLFQLHNISNIINNKNDDFHLFNQYLYQTLKFFYDIITTIDDDISDKKKNDSFKFSYFILSLMIILYKNKKKENNIKLDNQIYELLLKYVDFYTLHHYYNHRNLILSLLLDDSVFNQNEILKEQKIIVLLMAIIKNNLNNKLDIINEDILYKILNLDFILESKEYRHKLYMKLILSLLLIKNNKMIYKNIIMNIIHIKSEIKLYHYLKYIYINLEAIKSNLQKEENFISFIKSYSTKETNFFHCKYCFNIFFLIYQIKNVLQIEDGKNIKKLNMNLLYKNKDFLVKYKICLLKCKFINCFNMNSDIKFKFIKNNRCIFSSGNANSLKNNEENNKDSIIQIVLNLLHYIITSKLILNFDSIINDLYLIYTIYYENQQNYNSSEKIQNNSQTVEEREQLINIFDSLIFFWKGLIKFYKRGKFISKDHIDFLILLLNREGVQTFFRIYLVFDFKSAITILHDLIEISIKILQNPFYFNFIEIDENIDRYNKANNLKIKKEITEKIILEINKINTNDEIINENRINLLIIINEITKNSSKLSNAMEKYFLTYLKDLLEKNFFKNKIFYKKKEDEYCNILLLTLDILFEISRQNNYNKKYDDFIYQFIMYENKKSIFYLIDEESINNKTSNKKKEIDFSYILYSISFLPYFLDIKDQLLEKDSINDKNEDGTKIENEKEIIDNQLVFINR